MSPPPSHHDLLSPGEQPRRPGQFSFHMVHDEAFFRDCKDIELLTRTRAERIDREQKRLHITRPDGTTDSLPCDQRVLGTGWISNVGVSIDRREPMLAAVFFGGMV